jgi:hypothetical protein
MYTQHEQATKVDIHDTVMLDFSSKVYSLKPLRREWMRIALLDFRGSLALSISLWLQAIPVLLHEQLFYAYKIYIHLTGEVQKCTEV